MDKDDIELQKSVTYLTEVETVAQDLLTAKDQKLRYSDMANKHNEAIRELQKTTEKTTFLEVSSSFLEFPKSVALEILQQDAKTFKEEVERLDKEIRDKASRLRDLEHQPRITGLGLKPLSAAEVKALNKAYGV